MEPCFTTVTGCCLYSNYASENRVLLLPSKLPKRSAFLKEILEDAASKIGEDHINYDKHLKDIARDKRYWEEKRRRIHENEKRLDEVVEKYRQELTEASRLRKEIIKEAQQKAQEIIHSANKTIEQTIRDIRENQAEKEKDQRNPAKNGGRKRTVTLRTSQR